MKTLAQADKEARKAACDADGNLTGILEINEGLRYFRLGAFHLTYHGNGGSEPSTPASGFYVRRDGQEDDISSDYWAGSFHKTITGAIRSARDSSFPMRLVGGA